MGRLLIAMMVVVLVTSVASATVVTWTMTATANGDGTSRYLLKAQNPDGAIVGFTGTFYSSGGIMQLLGDKDGDVPDVLEQIDARADALAADGYLGYDKNYDTHVYTAFQFIPEPFTQTATSYGGFAGSNPPWPTTQGKTAPVSVLQLVSATGLDLNLNLGYRGVMGIWDGVTSHPVVELNADFGIPEPATLTLLGLGAVAALIRRRRLA